MSQTRDITILYDGDCPMCRLYSQHRALSEKQHRITLLDARENPALVAHYRTQNWDVNDGFIVKVGGAEYFGLDALTALNRLAHPNWRTRFMDWCLTRPRLGPFIYRNLARTRRLLLRLKRRPLIG